MLCRREWFLSSLYSLEINTTSASPSEHVAKYIIKGENQKKKDSNISTALSCFSDYDTVKWFLKLS